MAGIGLTLERLTSRGSFAGTFQALVYCCVVSCGPWLFTIICLGAMTWFGARHLDESRIALFGNIVIYNFAFSLVLTGPLTLICTRYLADRLYSRDIRTLNGIYLGAVTITNVSSLIVSFSFYFFLTDLPFSFVVAATIHFTFVSMLWLTSTFLHAIKNFNAFIFTFAVGMIVAFVAGSFLSTSNGALGMLWGFNVGLFIIVFVTIGIGISQYDNDIESPLSFIYYFKKYWDLALSGIIYYMAIWIDKWTMWFAADNVSTARNVVFNPIYDFPMFLAYLSLIPALSVFILHTETGFLKHYHLFYREIQAHASYSWLHDRYQRMVDCLLAGLKDIAILQASLTLCAVSLAPLIIELFGGEFRQVSIFRLGLIAAFFHMIFIFVTTQLYYFDLRKLNVCLHMLFLLTNGLFSYLTAVAGFPYYGYGYFASSLLSCVLSLIILSNVIKRLPYITFVSNNPSVL